MAESFNEFLQRLLAEYSQQKDNHKKEISDLLKKQADEIRKAGKLTPLLKAKFEIELSDLQALHKDLEAKLNERHTFEKNESDRLFEESQRLKRIVRDNIDKVRDKEIDNDKE